MTPKSSIADYSIRIFTSGGNELPFAGHPTLGTAFALLEDGKIKPNDNGQIIQECGAGLVKISVEKHLIIIVMSCRFCYLFNYHISNFMKLMTK